MTSAYILISVDKGSEKQVLSIAKSFGSVIEAYVCFGLYDLILKVELNSMKDLKELLIHKYGEIENIKSIIILFMENKKEILPLEPLINCSQNVSCSNEKTLKFLGGSSW